MIAPGQVGILPLGALAAGFFSDLTGGLACLEGDVVFLQRADSASARAIAGAGEIGLRDASGAIRRLPVARFLQADPERQVIAGQPLPEVILVAVSSDQVTRIVATMVAVAERLRAREEAGATLGFPAFIFCANGIYHGRLRGLLDERLEESVHTGRLTEEDRQGVNGALLRGVSYQQGAREGEGPGCVYVPGGTAGTTVCGGDPAVLARAVNVLQAKGGAFSLARHGNPLRAEFDKAALNLVANSWGVILSVEASGVVAPLTIGRIFGNHGATVETTVRALAAIGAALRIYPEGDDGGEILASLRAGLPNFGHHLSSSVAWVAREAAAGRLSADSGVPAADEAFIRPLARYARYAGLEAEALHFDELFASLENAIARAARSGS